MATWEEAVRKLEQLKLALPAIVGNEMVNSALDNIRDQVDVDGKPLKPRNPKAKRNTGRSILIDSGRGRRSIRDQQDGNVVELTAEDYMVAHNEGVDRTVTARSRKGKTHSRKMKLPKREIAGDSPKVRDRINKTVANEIVKALT